MPHPTHTNPQPEHPASGDRRVQATAGVPLAVWPLRPSLANEAGDGRTDKVEPDTADWLQQLFAECTPDGYGAHVYTVDDPVTDVADVNPLTLGRADPPLTGAAAFAPTESRPLGLLVFRTGQRGFDVEALTQLVVQARWLLQPGGRLAVVTHPAMDPGGPVLDPVSTTVEVAVTAGFGYLQHIVVGDLTALPPDPPSRTGPRPYRQHPVRHLNITLFQLTSPPANSRTSNSQEGSR